MDMADIFKRPPQGGKMKEAVPEFEEVRVREIPEEFQGIRRKTRKKIQKVLYLDIFKKEYRKKQAIKEVGISSSTFYKDEYEAFVEFVSEEFERKKEEIEEEEKGGKDWSPCCGSPYNASRVKR